MGFFDAVPRRSVILLAVLSLGGTGAQVAPPSSNQPTARTPALPGTGHTDDEDINPLARQMAEQQALRRNNQRQQLIVDDTAKLVHLAQQLKEDMDNGTMNHPGKKAEEIERLAKEVKDKMKEGQ